MIFNRNLFKTITLGAFVSIGIITQCLPLRAAETQILTVAGGCFWCVESDFESVGGVSEVISGYAGGASSDANYKTVTSGGTGHFEAVQIMYDPTEVSADKLLNMFFRSIDPTDAGGQFCDRGQSYRTAVFFSDEVGKVAALSAKGEAMGALGQKIVTPVLPLEAFYPAEDYHQDYYKGTNLVFTRFGPKRQSDAYDRYRKSCGRDARVSELWGDAAPFAKDH